MKFHEYHHVSFNSHVSAELDSSCRFPADNCYQRELLSRSGSESQGLGVLHVSIKAMNEKNFINQKLVPRGTDGQLLFSGFPALVTLTFNLNRVTRHTVMHHSSTSIYKRNFIEIGKSFCGRVDVQMDRQMYLLMDISDPPLMLLGRL